MKTPGSVLLLLWAAVVAKESKDLQDTTVNDCTQQTYQSDIHAVLREMSAVVVEQRVELRYTKTQVDQRAVIEELKEKQEEQAAAVRAVGGSVNLTGSQVEELRREREERRVAFSASLVASGAGTTGPFSAATPLVYRHVFTNVGNAYNPHTGVFTAPVRGVYHFVIHVDGVGHASTWTGASLHKNGKHVVMIHSRQSNGRLSSSNGVSLLLDVGDVVYVKLWPNSWVFDSYNHHTTFSGHLLFPM
ncbi:complement C1q-like protein 2 [Alosa alosa]|uniref:complement C1q-like protein 2 n=1 Tax=Alosa alosa TaxID=278164 RepID=UPI002015290E|nr:complement C1q-like protein 2 [Alosa alosa]